MDKFVQIDYLEIEENEEYNKIINKVIEMCFKEEKLKEKSLVKYI